MNIELARELCYNCSMMQEGLSPTEEKVLRLLVLGYTNQEAGNELRSSTRTVDDHRRNIYDKLGVTTRRELVAFALEKGYINSEAVIIKTDVWRKYALGLIGVVAILIAIILFFVFYQQPFEPMALATQPEQMTFALDYPIKIIVYGVEFTFTCAGYQWYLNGPIDFSGCNIHAEDAEVFWQRFKVYLPMVMK